MEPGQAAALRSCWNCETEHVRLMRNFLCNNLLRISLFLAELVSEWKENTFNGFVCLFAIQQTFYSCQFSLPLSLLNLSDGPVGVVHMADGLEELALGR
jgi:hypothetical protein